MFDEAVSRKYRWKSGVGSTRGREIPGGLEGRLQIIPNQSGSGLDPLNRIARSENRDFVGSPEVGVPTGCGVFFAA